MHFDVVLSVFIHPCTKKRRRAQYSRRVDAAVCVRALQMCACASDVSVCTRFRCASARFRFVRGKLLTSLDSYSNNPEGLIYWPCAFGAVLISSPDTWDWTRMHALVVMHRRTLCENVDSVKIKVPFYRYQYFTHGIDASYHHTLYWYIINPYRWIVTPLVFNSFSKSKSVSRRLL